MTVPARRSASVRGRIPFEDAVRRRVLENGAELFVLENHFNPTVAVSGKIEGENILLRLKAGTDEIDVGGAQRGIEGDGRLGRDVALADLVHVEVLGG